MAKERLQAAGARARRVRTLRKAGACTQSLTIYDLSIGSANKFFMAKVVERLRKGQDITEYNIQELK